MNKLLLLAFVLPVLLFTGACEKDFVVPEQAKLKGLVINSLFNDKQPLSLYLTDSYGSAGTNNVNSITDAKVDLYENGTFRETLSYVPSDSLNLFGQYFSTVTPQPGKTYKLIVSHPKYGEATTTDSVPLPVQIISSELVQYPDSNNHLTTAVVKLKIKDDGSHENYYRLNVWYYGTRSFIGPNGDTVSYDRSESLRPETQSYLADTIRDYATVLLFSDKTFNGQEKEMSLSFEHAPPSNWFNTEYLGVELHTVTKTHYEYFKTMNLYQETNGNDEPVHVYSNVGGGYGIFAGEEIQTSLFTIK